MQAVFIVEDPNVAKVLVDPMRRAILELLREKPMTQTQLADELGLTGASLSHHMKVLKSQKLVNIVKKNVESHGIVQTFFSTSAYLFVYDVKALPTAMSRYFYPIALERTRAVISVLLFHNKEYGIKKDAQTITSLSGDLSELLVAVSKQYKNKKVTFGNEYIIFDIYIKAIKQLVLKLSNKKNHRKKLYKEY